MAKKSDQAADSRGTAGVVGASTGFLAEEEHLDRAALLRLGMWGVAAIAAVTIAVLASQSSMKMRRDQFAASDFTRQSQQIQSIAKQSENEARRLASAIETLNGDRDRLFSRMSVLEHGLDSVTGSIVRQSAAVTPQPAPPAPTPPPQPVAQIPAPATIAAPLTVPMPVPAPIADPETTSMSAAAERSKADAPSSDLSPAPKRVATAAPSPSAPPEAAAGKLIEPEPPTKPVAAAPTIAAVPPAATTSALVEKEPQPSVTMVSTPPDKAHGKTSADEAGTNVAPVSPSLTVKRTEFAVDVGGANSVGGLRALWHGLLKTRANAPLAALQPMIVIKEASNGLGMHLRLVAGPLNDAAAAARICATLIANKRPCDTTVFDGQRLSLTAEQPPVSAGAVSNKSQSDGPDLAKPELAKPDPSSPDSAKSVAGKPPGKATRPSLRRQSYPQRVTVEEPPKPEPSLLSSFFGRSSQ